MSNCQTLDPLVTPFVDDQLADAERRVVEDHLRVCSSCHSRVAAERAVHDLLRARKATLSSAGAPDALFARCSALAQRSKYEGGSTKSEVPGQNPDLRPSNFDLRTSKSRAARIVPYTLTASLILVVGGAFVYQATAMSPRVMAAQLVADHTRCFSGVGAGERELASVVEQSLASTFDWQVHLPDAASGSQLELVGERTCFYGEGRVAHIMYRHQGQPVSLFMLPKSARAQELVEVLGHEAAIWCANNRTFVLVAREPRREVERMASFVQSALH
jgi:anti-sigma factor RsiW